MNCKEAQRLLAPHILGDLDDEPRICKELQAHLLSCPDCAEIYNEFRETIGFVLNHKPEFAQTFEKIRNMEKQSKEIALDCKQMQFLMALFIANDPDLTDQQHVGFRKHIESCLECAKEYKESKFVIELAKRYLPIDDNAADFIEEAGKGYIPKMTIEEGWKDLCRRCPELVGSKGKPKRLNYFFRLSAVAACLVIGILTWMVFLNCFKSKIVPASSLSQQITFIPKASVKVELVNPSGNIEITTDQKIAADNELKTLLINGKHQMTLNAGTLLSIEPLMANAQLGCLIKLEKGEIYTHVEHDGNPFVVETNSGKAVITGTTFNIKTDSQQTELIVTEGTVLFENENGNTNVKAGQISTLSANTKPTIPAACDIHSLTAWTTVHEPDIKLSNINTNDDYSWQPPLSTLIPKLINLEEVNYKQWVEEKREWFKKDFPWIFQLKEALAREGIEADYPELLIKAGDVWQFIYLDNFPARFSVPDFESLLKTAIAYGFNKKWLLKNVPIARIIQDKSSLTRNLIRLVAFDQLLKYANKTETIPYYLYPADACKYLAETRSLIWFAVINGRFNLTDTQQIKILDLLQNEVMAAYNCWNIRLNIFEPPKLSCDENLHKISNVKIILYIETIKTIEEKINEYQISQ